MIIGTGVIADFPTINGNIYTRECLEKLVSDGELQERIKRGDMIGGILDPATLGPVDGVYTHKVNDLRLFRGEVVVDIELLDDNRAKEMFSRLRKPQAAIIVRAPEKIKSGMYIVDVKSIVAVHLREETTCTEITSDAT